MPKFAYVATAADGAAVTGVQRATTMAEARQALLARQLWVTTLTEKAGGSLNVELTPSRIRRTDLMHLSRQLAAFLRAGIPILTAIDTLAEESDKAPVRQVMTAIGADLRAGSTLSQAIERHPKDFPPFYRGIVRSAELTGQLDTVLDQLSGYLERDVEARRKITSALVYPSVIAATALVTVVILSVFVLPKFETFFASLDAQLPLPTRLLLYTTRFFGTWWWLVVTLALALTLIAVGAVQTASGRRAWHRLLLAFPLIGETLQFALIERFTRVLASMVRSGVPLPESMQVATDSLNNTVFAEALGEARAAMVSGAGLAQPIAATKLFPGVASQMIRVGEDTGSLDSQLDVAAEFYERELDYKIKKMTALIEPVVTLVMGGLVGFVAVALVSAMYGIFRSANLG